jgi:hypothetical protein
VLTAPEGNRGDETGRAVGAMMGNGVPAAARPWRPCATPDPRDLVARPTHAKIAVLQCGMTQTLPSRRAVPPPSARRASAPRITNPQTARPPCRFARPSQATAGGWSAWMRSQGKDAAEAPADRRWPLPSSSAAAREAASSRSRITTRARPPPLRAMLRDVRGH